MSEAPAAALGIEVNLRLNPPFVLVGFRLALFPWLLFAACGDVLALGLDVIVHGIERRVGGAIPGRSPAPRWCR